LGLDVDPSDVKSVLILGGRRGPDITGRSHNVCLLSTSRTAGVVCGSFEGGVGRGKDDPAHCGVDEGGSLGVGGVWVGAGCVAVGGELNGIGRTGSDDFRGENAGALGFIRPLDGKGAVSERDDWDWGSSRTVFVNEGSGFVTGVVGWTAGAGGKNEDGTCKDINSFDWWGRSTDSGGSP